jgi:hypothetical protein
VVVNCGRVGSHVYQDNSGVSQYWY